jgi:hypothetical protein
LPNGGRFQDWGLCIHDRVSNAGLNGNEGGNTSNSSVNTPAGMVVGFSW